MQWLRSLSVVTIKATYTKTLHSKTPCRRLECTNDIYVVVCSFSKIINILEFGAVEKQHDSMDFCLQK